MRNLTLKKIVKSPTHRAAETGHYSLQVIAKKKKKKKRILLYRHYIRIVLHTKRASCTKKRLHELHNIIYNNKNNIMYLCILYIFRQYCTGVFAYIMHVVQQ